MPALVNLLQEIAWNHSLLWEVSIYQMLPLNISWVMSRMKIVVHRLPRHADEVCLQSWIQATDRYFCFRAFEMTLPDGTVLVEATSVWGVLDIEKRRVVTMPEWIREKNFVHEAKPALPPASGKIPSFEQFDYEKSFSIRWHDIDNNQHANNTCYFGWMLETLPADFLSTHQLRSFDIIFRAESTLADSIVGQATSSSSEGNYSSFVHKILNDQGKELAQAQTTWSNH